jgi:hypothetical protein
MATTKNTQSVYTAEMLAMMDPSTMQQDEKCWYTITWHADRPEQRNYRRSAPQHDAVAGTPTFTGAGWFTPYYCSRCGKELD